MSDDTPSDKAKAIPKFSSFKPKKNVGAFGEAAQQAATTSVHAHGSRSHSHSKSLSHAHAYADSHSKAHSQSRSSAHSLSHSHSHSQARSRNGKNDRHHVDHRNSTSSKPREIPRPVDPLESTDLYLVDTNGDPQNATYQRLHRYSVPSYHRVGYGNVLGLDCRFKIDPESSQYDVLDLLDKRALGSHHHSRPLYKKRKLEREVQLVHQSPVTKLAFDPAQEFVPIESSKPPRIGVESQLSDHEDRDLATLRFSEPQVNAPADPDLQYTPDLSVNEDATDPHLSVRLQNTELVRATRSNPASLQTWLQLIAHQEHLVRPPARIDEFSTSERRTLADMRVSIYDKAAKALPMNKTKAREQLLHSMLQEACLLDPVEHAQRMNSAIEELPNSTLLWTHYLNTAQTAAQDFRFENIKAFYLKCLERSATSASDEARDMQLYILLRYTTLLRDSGYDELSVAIWQALSEFHLFAPSSIAHASPDVALDAFEQFWESELPRFGEPDARGWRNSDQDDTENASQSRDLSPEVHADSNHPFARFALTEEKAGAIYRFPGKTLEENAPDDPFHIVFFADLEAAIRPTAFAPLPGQALLDALLCFLGLPALPVTTASSTAHHQRVEHWRSDVFLSDGLVQSTIHRRDAPGPDQHRLRLHCTTSDLLFSGLFPDITLHSGASDSAQPKHWTEVLLFLRRLLASLVPILDDDNLAEYYLAFECHYFKQEASKTAKAILKSRPSSLRLYNACAMVETTLGRHEKADRVWMGALSMRSSLPAPIQQDAVLLWRSWVWDALLLGHKTTALARLLSFGRDPPPNLGPEGAADVSSASTLSAKRAMRDGFDHALSQSHLQNAHAHVDCTALLLYLAEPDGLSAAFQAIDEHCNIVFSALHEPDLVKLVLVELLHQSKARIIDYHMQQKSSYRPAQLRSELEASIKLFPNNTIFLSLHRDNEARFRLDDRVRSIFKDEDLAKQRSPLVRSWFAIDSEISRHASQASGSTIESVRAAFARALHTIGSPVSHSRALWWKWLLFEQDVYFKQLAVATPAAAGSARASKHHHPDSQRWKTCFLNGLANLPWVKDWVLYGLRVFDSRAAYGWSATELQRLCALALNRELRIRTDGLGKLVRDNA